MEKLQTPTTDIRLPWWTRVLAALVFIGGLLMCASSVTDGSWNGEQAPFPYVWRDVAIVHFLCALPLAWMLAAFFHRRLPAAVSVGLSALILGVSIVPFLGAVRASLMTALLSHPHLGVVLRAAPALGLTLSAALVLPIMMGRRWAAGQQDRWGAIAVIAGLGVVVLSIYVNARCQHRVARLGELLEQARYGEARPLVHDLLFFDANRQWKGHSLSHWAADVDRKVVELESRVAVPLPVDATSRERFDRAHHLAMLGRTDEALDVLQSVTEPALAPQADHLRGTIHEARGDWETALAAYQSARAGAESLPQSGARANMLFEATRGIAYCQQRMGHYAEAEAAYQQMLALSPTADSHFRLAQFYRQAEDAEKAHHHARRAIDLDRRQYQQKGEQLINDLAVYRFGCLGVFRAEKQRFNASSR